MTTNLKLTLNNKKDINAEDNAVTFTLASPLEAWNNGATGNGEFDLIGEGFPIDDNHYHNVDSREINRVEIKIPDDDLFFSVYFNLAALLKNEIKTWGDHAQNLWDFELILDKVLTTQADHWNITPPSEPGKNDRILKLTAADFGSAFDESKISIDDTEYHGDPNNKIKVVENRHDQKQAVVDLINILKPIVEEIEKFGIGPDANLPEFSQLGDPPSPSNPTPKTGLWSYVHGKILNFADISQEPKNIKHVLCDLDFEDDFKVKNWIETILKIVEVLRVLKPVGITKKSHFAIIFGSIFDGGEGYEFEKKERDIEELIKEPGFYKGFPLLDPNLKAVPNSAKGNKFKVEKIDPSKPRIYSKLNIDNFRDFATGYTGPNAEVFTKMKTIKKPNGEEVQVYANRLPEELLGFQPGNIYLSNKNKKRYHNSGSFFRGASKIVEDIWNAQNADEALDLAFYGKDYNEPRSRKAIRKDNPVYNVLRKHPNINLKFNEIRGESCLDALKRYYEALKETGNCRWIIAGNNTGAGWKEAPKYGTGNADDQAVKEKIDKGFELAEKFIEDYEKLISVSIDSLDKTQLEEAKAKLEKWKETRFYTSGGVWVPVIDNFLTEVEEVLSRPDDEPDDDEPEDRRGPTDDDIPTWHTELVRLKDSGSELGKKIYQNCEPDRDGFTEAVFTELKKLVKLLEEAHGTKTANTKSELEKFISDSENNANQKKALEIAKKIKNQDHDHGDCVATAWEKLKSPSEKQLEKAQAKLKSLLTGLKINGKDAYEEIITAIKDSETDINNTIKIWQKCLEIDAATNDDNGELLEALNNLKNDPHNQKAWEAVNKYQRGEHGFCDEMLKKTNDWAEQRKKDYQDIKNAKNKVDFEKIKEKFMKKPEYKNNKQDYDEIYFPLAEKATEIHEKGTGASSQEKEISELITVVLSDYNDWKTQLEELENKLNKLKSIPKKELENFSTIQKQALEKLVSKMEIKVQEWRAEKSKSENNNLENPAWYKTPLGVIGIIGGVFILAGAIFVWWRKTASGKERGNKNK
ncbi:MAG: hypothetical protein I3270_02205 [Candidatus Moeniiplasma glomeromycotorum]|nr:hypothetical protein [Candidatus Moeniiplasma glomeromycotorum]MCE8162509.1 hypothetical protein [Candidatus Moeniiplasma glomeromycotorum]MCE8166436.1 hypothetical protein [Candidatus Moeniiplasma glomeromycotorum]MCE8166921.1 hypothetical protein [Candidatus Moeniiplasma glomeromycotorum]